MTTPAKPAHTPGPYFVGSDDASDCPDHHNSGLALVDTGRHSDWPIARLCEWNNAAFIVRACNAHDDLLAALRGMVRCYAEPSGPHCGNIVTGDDRIAATAAARAAIAKEEA